MERTHEEATEALYTGRENRHSEAVLLEQVPISELCDKHGLQPTVFYRWQKEFFENGTAAFQPKGRPNHCRTEHLSDMATYPANLCPLSGRVEFAGL